MLLPKVHFINYCLSNEIKLIASEKRCRFFSNDNYAFVSKTPSNMLCAKTVWTAIP